MNVESPPRPRISRETRLLLSTALLAVIALGMLARLRFPDRAAAPAQGIAPILAPLVPRQSFADLAEQFTEIANRARPNLVAMRVVRSGDEESAGTVNASLTGLRLRDDVVVLILRADERLDSQPAQSLIGRDAATGLAAVRVPPEPMVAVAAPSFTVDGSASRYVLTSAPLTKDVALLPLLVTGFARQDAPLWGGEVLVPAATGEMAPGSFVFTLDGEWAGLAARRGASSVLVPARLVAAAAERLLARTTSGPASLGIEVQALTPALTRATKAASGAIVSWVDPEGPAAGALQIGDVLETANHQRLPTYEHWQRLLADLIPQSSVALTVRRGDEVAELEVVPIAIAPALAPETAPTSQALALRLVRGEGSEIVGIDPRSALAAAGLRVGDLVTQVATMSSPTPAQLRRSIASATAEHPVVIALRRGHEHLVLAVEP